MPNRINPLAPPAQPNAHAAAPAAWWKSPVALRVAFFLAGGLLGLSCPLWPAPAQPLCIGAARLVTMLPSIIESAPPVPDLAPSSPPPAPPRAPDSGAELERRPPPHRRELPVPARWEL
jgi:hypothetical protein